jgi:hypothetical protein
LEAEDTSVKDQSLTVCQHLEDRPGVGAPNERIQPVTGVYRLRKAPFHMCETGDIFLTQPFEQSPTGNAESAKAEEDRPIKAIGSSSDRISSV